MVEVLGYITGNLYGKIWWGFNIKIFDLICFDTNLLNGGLFCILKMVSSPIKKIHYIELFMSAFNVRVLFSVICGDSCSLSPDTVKFNKVEYKVLAFALMLNTWKLSN